MKCKCGKKCSKKGRCKSCANRDRAGKYHWSTEAREKIKGRRNHYWKEKVTYSALHNWLRRNKPKPELCETCGKFPAYDMANISGKYKKSITDYKYICRKCHMIEDGRLVNLIKNIIVGVM